jgi:hypothetical protein
MFNGGVILFPLTAGNRDQLGSLEFSCVEAETHAVENEITGYPVETGFIVADHAIKKNRKLALNIRVGNTLNTGNVVNTVGNSGITPVGAVVPSEAIRTPQDAHDILTKIVMEARECQVSTIYGVYNHAIITKYQTRQDSRNVLVLVAKLEIQDIYKVDVSGAASPKSSVIAYDNTALMAATDAVSNTN